MINPGDTEHLAVTINCGKLSGGFTRKITVSTNDADNPKMILTCKGKILEGARVSPKNANFGKVKSSDSAQTRTLTLTRGDGGPISPKLRPIKNKSYSAKINEVEPGEKYELIVTYSPPFDSNMSRSKLQIETGVANAPTVDINAYAVVQPHVAAKPRHIIVPPNRNKDFIRTVELSWTEGKGHKIIGASTSDSTWLAQVVAIGGKDQIKLTIPQGAEPAPGSHHLYIKTDDPLAPSVSVPISFRKTPRRSLTANPTPVDRTKISPAAKDKTKR